MACGQKYEHIGRVEVRRMKQDWGDKKIELYWEVVSTWS